MSRPKPKTLFFATSVLLLASCQSAFAPSALKNTHPSLIKPNAVMTYSDNPTISYTPRSQVPNS